MTGWKLGTIAGIDIRVHWTFLILPIFVATSTLSAGAGMVRAIESVVFVLALFGCVLLHELGHALMARRFHIGTHNITLLPIGGVASLDRMPERPRDELAVAFAGPAVNAVLAVVLFGILLVAGVAQSIFNPSLLIQSFLIRLFWANVILAGFNLLPAFPMDGGRVLRAVLAMSLPYVQATNIAARVGQVMAVLFALAGIFWNQWMLVLVAMFVYFAGRAEARMVRAKATLKSALVGDAMQRRFHMVSSEMTLDQAARAVLFTNQNDFPVIEDRRLVGLLSKHQSLQLLAQGRGYLRVSEVMRQNVPTLDQDTPLIDTFNRMQIGSYSSLPVIHCGKLVGLITAATLRDWLSGWSLARPATG